MSELQEIRDILSNIHAELHEFRAVQFKICENAAHVREGHTKTLYGSNGISGIVAKVQTMEETTKAITTIPTRVKVIEERISLIWLGILGFFGMVGKFIWDIISAQK